MPRQAESSAMSERQSRSHFLGSVEVVKPMQTDGRWQEPAQVAELFEIASREDEAIRVLRAGFADLLEAQEAKQSIKDLTASEISAFLEYRRRGSEEVRR